jgi:hypothetical protein
MSPCFARTASAAARRLASSSESSGVLTIRRTPSAPISASTPRYTPEMPKSPSTQAQTGMTSPESVATARAIRAAAADGAKYAEPVLSSATTSAPPLRVRTTSSSIFSAGMTSRSGLPLTVLCDGTGTIVSPCEPSVRVRTDATGTASASATKVVNRAVSSMPAWPSTRCFGNWVASWASAVISSSGLETTMTTAFGAYFATFSDTWRTILELVSSRSIRLMPGLRGRPAVMTTTFEPSMAS